MGPTAVLEGGPARIDSDRYQISAKAGGCRQQGDDERARSHVPELGNVLMCVVQDGASFGQPCKGRIHDGVVRVIAPRDSEQDIGIDQMRRGRR